MSSHSLQQRRSFVKSENPFAQAGHREDLRHGQGDELQAARAGRLAARPQGIVSDGQPR